MRAPSAVVEFRFRVVIFSREPCVGERGRGSVRVVIFSRETQVGG